LNLGGAVDPKAPADEFTVILQKQLDLANQVYPNGSYWEITKLRLGEFGLGSTMLVFTFPYYLSVFIFGVWIFKLGVFENLEKYKPLLKKTLNLSLPIGLMLSIPSALITENSSMMAPATSMEKYMQTLEPFASFILCMAYVSGFLLLAMNNTFKLRSALAPVGRMALSNYILQSLVFTIIFYGYGFGLWGTISRTGLIVLVLVFFILQCVLSHWWMSKYRFGPLEWVWRKMTYGKI